jgi:hypothetical protein
VAVAEQLGAVGEQPGVVEAQLAVEAVAVPEVLAAVAVPEVLAVPEAAG